MLDSIYFLRSCNKFFSENIYLLILLIQRNVVWKVKWWSVWINIEKSVRCRWLEICCYWKTRWECFGIVTVCCLRRQSLIGTVFIVAAQGVAQTGWLGHVIFRALWCHLGIGLQAKGNHKAEISRLYSLVNKSPVAPLPSLLIFIKKMVPATHGGRYTEMLHGHVMCFSQWDSWIFTLGTILIVIIILLWLTFSTLFHLRGNTIGSRVYYIAKWGWKVMNSWLVRFQEIMSSCFFQVLRCSNIAVVKVTELTKLIQKALENDAKARWVLYVSWYKEFYWKILITCIWANKMQLQCILI
jgi:hypothetical protein